MSVLPPWLAKEDTEASLGLCTVTGRPTQGGPWTSLCFDKISWIMAPVFLRSDLAYARERWLGRETASAMEPTAGIANTKTRNPR